MIGIYKYTNKTNNKSYIGQSIKLEERKKEHERYYLNPKHNCYKTKFYCALRKYGLENFTYEILEQGEYSEQELNELEIYYINYFDTYYNDYNSTLGGDMTAVSRKLNEEQILQIKQLLANTDLSLSDIAEKFGLNRHSTMIGLINKGKCWTRIGNYNYPIRKECSKLQNSGGKNPNAILSDKEVIIIRERFVNETLPQIYNDYENIISFNELKKIVYGSQFKHLPIYKKRQKQWLLKGTCIDYPGLQE